MDERDGNRGDGWVRLTAQDGGLRPLREVEAEAIRHAIVVCGGNLSEVARRLGIGRATLYRRLGRDGGRGPAPRKRHMLG